MQIIIKAFKFAAINESKTLRKNPEKPSKISHSIQVAAILSEKCKDIDPEIITAAILFRTAEDTDITKEDFIMEFGNSVSEIIQNVAEPKFLTKRQNREKQLMIKMDEKVGLINLANKLYYLRNFENFVNKNWNRTLRRGYLVWSEMVCNKIITESISEDNGIIIEIRELLDKYFNDYNIEEQGKQFILEKYLSAL